uniref:Transporter 1, ATP binding cassette subfamily B member n=1 Tax=Anas platyrhynchos TaxID=8839 RepID=A0A8B9SNW1_ANAPL
MLWPRHLSLSFSQPFSPGPAPLPPHHAPFTLHHAPLRPLPRPLRPLPRPPPRPSAICSGPICPTTGDAPPASANGRRRRRPSRPGAGFHFPRNGTGTSAGTGEGPGGSRALTGDDGRRPPPPGVAAPRALALRGGGGADGGLVARAVTELACDIAFVGTLSRVHGHLQRRLFAAVLRGDIAELRDEGAGDVAARVTGDVEATREALGEALSLLLWYLARGICLFSTMAWLSPHMALVTALVLPFLLLLPRAIGRLQQGLAPKVQKALAHASEVAVETFQAMATVRSFANEDGVAARYRQCLHKTHQLEKQDAVLYAVSAWTSGFSALALKMGILYYGGQLVAAGTISTGDLVTFLLYQLQFTDVVEVLLRYYPTLTKAVGSSEKIFEFLDREPQVAPSGTLAPSDLRGHLQLEDVWFSYPGRQEPVLKGVSLELRPGEVVALMGPPGAGKSTLVSLLLRLHQPTAGRLLLDGHPLSAYRHSYLCHRVATVPQEPVLFARSLHANIAYGPESWSRAQVTAAACRVGAHNFITRLPRGYDTEVGELGGQLSGGQRQGVAIARALVRDPHILVLDEPTSALDAECQQQVERELFEDSGTRRTVLLVTGQVALAARAHQVALMEGGQLLFLLQHRWGSPGAAATPASPAMPGAS